MASQEQAHCKAGETRAHAEEKTDGMMDKGMEATEATKNNAQHAEEKVSETTEAAKAQEGKDRTGSYLKDKTEAAKHKACDAAQSAKDAAQAGKEKTGGFFRQTGDKVKSAAQGAADAVKSTLGMGGEKEDADATATRGD